MEKHVHPYTKQTDCSIISTLLDVKTNKLVLY